MNYCMCQTLNNRAILYDIPGRHVQDATKRNSKFKAIKEASQTGRSIQLKVKKDVIGRCSNSSYATLSIVHYP